MRARKWRLQAFLGVAFLIAAITPLSMTWLENVSADCACSLFGTPTGAANFSEGTDLELGVKVIPDQDGYISGVKFYKQGAMSGVHTGRLWAVDGTPLASITYTETASGWQEATFSTPVFVTAGTTYVASTTFNDGRYIATSSYFTTDIINGPLKAPSSASSGGNGVFAGNGGDFPASSFNAANYWIDVIFFATAQPEVTAVTPTAGATNEQLGTTISATFSTSMDTATLTSDKFIVEDASGDPVPGVISYDGASKTASFVADEGFEVNTEYTILLKGGTGDVLKNNAGLPLAADYTWSFTTTATSVCPCSLKEKVNPTNVLTATDAAPVELGVKIKPSSNGYITSLRYFKPLLSNDTTNAARVWSSTGTSLASATFDNQSDYGWQEAKLSTPLRVYKNQLYIISYTASSTYVSSNGALTGQNIQNGYLTAFANDSSENAATSSGNRNGVFNINGGNYPGTGSTTGNYYWIDAVFSTTSTITDPLTVEVTQPGSGAYGVATDAEITAQFNRVLDSATVTNASFRLFNSSGAQVSGTASYDSRTGGALFMPSSPLSAGTRYTAKIAASVADGDGAALGSEYEWSFTVGSAVSPTLSQGAGGPILVVTSSANPYSTYYAEILRAEGLNEFEVKDIDDITPTVLTNYNAVILSELSLSAAQAAVFMTWVNAGGDLVAMRPDGDLASLLGISSAGGTLTNQYLMIDTTQAPGEGLVDETIQFKGVADNYTLSGARAVATLYSDVSTSTTNPAVTTRQVGTKGGSATAFTYDLAKSVIALHQGNQAWAGQERDGSSPRRANDLFFGARTGDVQPDWVNLNKMHIPQADEQQRLLANTIIDATKEAQPLPRFWYLPHDYKAAMVMAGDDHGLSNANGTEKILNNWLNDSPTYCSEMDWECVRATHYIYASSALTNTRAGQYYNLGFEIGDHVDSACTNLSYAATLNQYNADLAIWRAKYTSLPDQLSHRFHCYAWGDWDSQTKIDDVLGIRYDLNYVAYPASWIGSNATVMTGSAMNMRFTDATGSMLDVRQGVTNFDDQASTATNINVTLANAVGAAGYYGIFGTHYDMTNPFDKTLAAAARTYNVPMISAEQALLWQEGRESSTISDITATVGRTNFTLSPAEGANGLRTMLPVSNGGGSLTTLLRGASTVPFDTSTIKGIEYAVFDALPGEYEATYSNYTPPDDEELETPAPEEPGAPTTPSSPDGESGNEDGVTGQPGAGGGAAGESEETPIGAIPEVPVDQNEEPGVQQPQTQDESKKPTADNSLWVWIVGGFVFVVLSGLLFVGMRRRSHEQS